MDWALLPPEINSLRMYTGPGASPMIAAATAWDALSAQLTETSEQIGASLTALAPAWRGPSSLGMFASGNAYVSWLLSTAQLSSLTAAQARLAVAAYEAAFAATVPPYVVAANRAQLAALVATNFLGINTAAIMATEAEYAEMWAQDATAMYTYAGASMAASRLTPFTPVPQVTKGTPKQPAPQPPGWVQQILQGLNGNSSSGQDSWWWNNFGPNANIWNTIFSSGFYMPSNTLGAFTSLFGAATSAAGAAADIAGSSSGAIFDALSAALSRPALLTGSLGRATSLNGLSVPPSWTAAVTEAAGIPKAALPNAVPDETHGLPGFPGMPMASVPRGQEPQKQNAKYLPRSRMLPNPVN